MFNIYKRPVSQLNVKDLITSQKKVKVTSYENKKKECIDESIVKKCQIFTNPSKILMKFQFKCQLWDFPSDLVAKSPCSHCRGPRFETYRELDPTLKDLACRHED